MSSRLYDPKSGIDIYCYVLGRKHLFWVSQDIEKVYIDDDNFVHNDNGPAVESKYGTFTAYFKHGKLHRVDGPALQQISKDKVYNHYYMDGKVYTYDQFNKITEGVNPDLVEQCVEMMKGFE